jgi:hypothetical protein
MRNPARGCSRSELRATAYNGDGSLATLGESPRKGGRSIDGDPTPTGSLPDGAQEKASDKGYEINFENTPVPTVAKAILGDILGIGYTIDPRVQGTVKPVIGACGSAKRSALCPRECAAHERCRAGA